MQTQKTHNSRAPESLPPMVQGVKYELLSLIQHMDAHNYRPILAEIGRIADWWLGELSEEANDGNNAE